jgi:hypothetical protein
MNRRVRFQKHWGDFENEWEKYPDNKVHDDTLDALDIVLRTAGMIMPGMFDDYMGREEKEDNTNLRTDYYAEEDEFYDEEMGAYV